MELLILIAVFCLDMLFVIFCIVLLYYATGIMKHMIKEESCEYHIPLGKNKSIVIAYIVGVKEKGQKHAPAKLYLAIAEFTKKD